MSTDVWERIEQARERWNVLDHPFYQRWSAGELTPRGAGRLLGPVPARHRRDRRPQRLRRRVGTRGRARGAAPPRRRGGGPRRALGRLRRGRRRRQLRRADARDARVRRGLDGGGRPPLPARPPLRDRERPAGDLADQARGARRSLRDRGRARQRVLPAAREGRRPPCGRGSLADRAAPRRRRPGRPGGGRRGRLQGQLAAARRRPSRSACRRATSAMIEIVIAALPLLVLLASLLFGRYPGLETAMRIADRIASRARARVSAALDSRRPRPPAAHAAHGGQLLAFSIAGRAPPA